PACVKDEQQQTPRRPPPRPAPQVPCTENDPVVRPLFFPIGLIRRRCPQGGCPGDDPAGLVNPNRARRPALARDGFAPPSSLLPPTLQRLPVRRGWCREERGTLENQGPSVERRCRGKRARPLFPTLAVVRSLVPVFRLAVFAPPWRFRGPRPPVGQGQ